MRNKTLQSIFPEPTKIDFGNPLALALPLDQRVPSEQDARPDNGTAAIQGLKETFELLLRPGAPDLQNTVLGADSKAGSGVGDLRIPEAFGSVARNLEQLKQASEAQTAVVSANTAAVVSNTAKSAGQALASAGKVASGFLGGFTASPLISGVLKLFGLGGTSGTDVPVSTKYQAPAPIHFNESVAGTDPSRVEEVSYDRFGAVRVPMPDRTAVPQYQSRLADLVTANRERQADVFKPEPEQINGLQNVAESGESKRLMTGPQVTVNISAMDSKSFLDRSHDIAQAVREAMLNMHSINDVVNDL